MSLSVQKTLTWSAVANVPNLDPKATDLDSGLHADVLDTMVSAMRFSQALLGDVLDRTSRSRRPGRPSGHRSPWRLRSGSSPPWPPHRSPWIHSGEAMRAMAAEIEDAPHAALELRVQEDLVHELSAAQHWGCWSRGSHSFQNVRAAAAASSHNSSKMTPKPMSMCSSENA